MESWIHARWKVGSAAITFWLSKIRSGKRPPVAALKSAVTTAAQPLTISRDLLDPLAEPRHRRAPAHSGPGAEAPRGPTDAGRRRLRCGAGAGLASKVRTR